MRKRLLRGPPQTSAAMKWATLICLLLCTIVTESRYLKKRDADHHTRLIGGISIAIGQNNLDRIVLVMLTQNFQKCTLEQQLKGVEEFRTFTQHCVDHEDDAECQKPLMTLFHDKVCKHPHLDESYPWSVECCAKQEPEREKCFHDHRDIKVEPYQKPNEDFICKDLIEHPEQAVNYYIYHIAKRHSTLPPPSVVTLAGHYHNVVTECCAAEERDKCFETKFTQIQKNIIYMENQMKHVCSIISDFPERVIHAKKLAILAMRYPGSSFEVISKLTVESVNSLKDCCQGHEAECMVERLELNNYICENYEKISPNLKVCCEKPILERTPCMYTLPKEEAPADLPKEMKEFIEDEHVCQHFAEEKDNYLAKFLFEFARRHLELSTPSILRVAKGYHHILDKCCATENPVECLKTAPQLLEAGIKASQDLAKMNCEAYKKLGPYGYNIELIGSYTPKMPQVSDETLLEITGKMTAIGGQCCALPENQSYACGEDKLDMLLGNMCERQAHTFTNEQVRHCCTASYADRRPCFTKLGTDPSYKPPALDVSALQVDAADICEGSEQDQKNKRLTMLIRLLKAKPDLSREAKLKTVGEFTNIREKCCAEADHKACFDREGPAFILHLKETLGH